jgi:hypothetical protein
MKLIALAADGAACFQGRLNGMLTRIKQIYVHILTTICCNHKLQTAIKDALSANNLLPLKKTLGHI